MWTFHLSRKESGALDTGRTNPCRSPGRNIGKSPPFTALLSIIDFIDRDMPRIENIGELKAALVIWRKTHGWGKLSERIGTTELQRRTGLARSTIQRNVGALKFLVAAEPTKTTRGGNTLHLCRILSWPINDRAFEQIAKAERAKGGEDSTGGRGAPPDEAARGRKTQPGEDSSGGRGAPRNEAIRGRKTPPPEGAQRGDSSDYSSESSTSTESITSAASGRQMCTVNGAQPETGRYHPAVKSST